MPASVVPRHALATAFLTAAFGAIVRFDNKCALLWLIGCVLAIGRRYCFIGTPKPAIKVVQPVLALIHLDFIKSPNYFRIPTIVHSDRRHPVFASTIALQVAIGPVDSTCVSVAMGYPVSFGHLANIIVATMFIGPATTIWSVVILHAHAPPSISDVKDKRTRKRREQTSAHHYF